MKMNDATPGAHVLFRPKGARCWSKGTILKVLKAHPVRDKIVVKPLKRGAGPFDSVVLDRLSVKLDPRRK